MRVGRKICNSESMLILSLTYTLDNDIQKLKGSALDPGPDSIIGSRACMSYLSYRASGATTMT